MPQRVWSRLDAEAGDPNVFPDDPLDRTYRHPHPGAARSQVRFAFHADEKRFPAGVARLEVVGQGLGCRIAEEDDARLAAFADHPELAGLQVDVVAVQTRQLGEAQPGAEE